MRWTGDTVFQLEDETSPSNVRNLIETMTSSESQVSGVGENAKQIFSVFEDIVRVEESRDERTPVECQIIGSRGTRKRETHQLPEDIRD